MIRQNRRTIRLSTLLAASSIALGMALGAGSLARAAGPAATTSQPPTIAQLQARADQAARRASTALTLAQREDAAASSAEANLRLAEANLAALRNLDAASAPLPAIASQQLGTGVATAQSQLSMAQQSEMQAELRAASVPPVAPALPGAPANPAAAILDQSAQLELQNARDDVARAQRNLLAAQQAQDAGAQTATVRAGGTAAGIRNAEIAVETAQRLATAARRAASAAALQAQRLATTADAAAAALKDAEATADAANR